MILEILIILLLVGINALFVTAEMALISMRESRLQELDEAGDSRAKAALDLLRSPENFLSTIQIGLSLIMVLSGAVGGASLAEDLMPRIAEIPNEFVRNNAHLISFSVTVLFKSIFNIYMK